MISQVTIHYWLQHAAAMHRPDLNMKNLVKLMKNEISIISWQNHPPPGFEPRTSHSTVSRFTICAISPDSVKLVSLCRVFLIAIVLQSMKSEIYCILAFSEVKHNIYFCLLVCIHCETIFVWMWFNAFVLHSGPVSWVGVLSRYLCCTSLCYNVLICLCIILNIHSLNWIGLKLLP